MRGLSLEGYWDEDKTKKMWTEELQDQVLESIELDDLDALRFKVNGSTYYLYDDGQCCCENRYMTCHDDLTSFTGGTLLGVRVAEGPSSEGEWGDCHEVQFLRLYTSKGVIVCETHNEHNGYYGGFNVRLKKEGS